MEEITRSLETARDVYDRLYFNTDALFNEPAPDPIVSFVIGGVSGKWESRLESDFLDVYTGALVYAAVH